MTHNHKGWYSRGYLPHLDAPETIQHITFHLSDSLPGHAIAQMQSKLATMPETKRKQEHRKRIQDLLDAGMGSCILRRPEAAAMVEQVLFYWDGDRYRLLAWTVMPNHVHVLIEQIASLPQIVGSWKRTSSKYIRDLGLERSPQPIWQRDYWDRYVRSHQHYQTVRYYIDQNSVQAGLVRTPEEWSWGSARFL